MPPSDENASGKVLKIGTRKSPLAMLQTEWIVGELKKLDKSLDIEIVPMATIGDKILDKPLPKTGEKSLFTKELEVALADDQVHLVVNSMKDMPSTLPPNLTISAVSKRVDPHDAVVMHPKHKGKRLDDLDDGSVIGTSSLRRIAQLKRKYPNLKFKSVRGNLNTRLRKLDEANDYDALILAAAGLIRMGWENRISYTLDTDDCLYAVGQGALAVETRSDDFRTIDIVSKLHDTDTVIRCIAERAFLRTLEGGCSVPTAVETYIKDKELYMKAGVYSLDGSEALIEKMQTTLVPDEDWDKMIRAQDKSENCEFASITISYHFISPFLLKTAGHLGRDIAQLLLNRGARRILDEARRQNEMSNDL
ncbi:porphobilinogen deaminase-like [Styela clava]|uniref:porphobilinogen deaminase-like n=1 Tax=Styela clava TaxID=7725 RepID=UPI00193AC56A|nr:porphobilinogen deaminase-like [Styela clava]